jgi:alanyl-tRNA synthetase
MEETQKMKEKEKEKRLEKKQIAGEKIPKILSTFSQSEQKVTVVDNIIMERAESNKPVFCYSVSDDYDDDFHIKLGESLCKNEQNLVYCGIFDDGEKVRVIVYCSEQASKNKKAGDIVKSISEILGGAGGGNPKFAQGGGNDKSKKEDAVKKAKSIVLE